MKRAKVLWFLVLPLLATNSYGDTTIDFGPAFGAPATEVELTNQLSSYGVTFSSTSPDGVLWLGTTPTIGAFSYCISPGWYVLDEITYGRTDPIQVDFAFPVTQASIRGFDGGGDVDTLVLTAYDSSNTQVDLATITSDFDVPGSTASVSAPGIAYITFQATGVTSGLFFDDLIYDIEVAIAIDIKPGSCPNPFNAKSQGSVPVAIVGTALFDVTTIDPASITLAGVPALAEWEIKDSTEPDGDNTDCFTCFDASDPANFNCDLDPLIPGDDAYCGDGFPDLIVKFDTQVLADAIGAQDRDACVTLTLTGELLDGTPFSASDSIVIKTQ